MERRDYFILFILLPVLGLATCCEAPTPLDEESGRTLVFWNGGIIKFIVGWTIPLPLHVPFVTLFTHSIQMAYPLISNASEITALLQQGLAKGVRMTKRSAYYLLDRFFRRFGTLNRNCFTRLICELNRITVVSPVAQALQSILRPDEEGSYATAWQRGVSDENCQEHYFCSHADSFGVLTSVQYV